MTIYDVVQAIGVFSLIFFLLFVRSQYLRVEQVCVCVCVCLCVAVLIVAFSFVLIKGKQAKFSVGLAETASSQWKKGRY